MYIYIYTHTYTYMYICIYIYICIGLAGFCLALRTDSWGFLPGLGGGYVLNLPEGEVYMRYIRG